MTERMVANWGRICFERVNLSIDVRLGSLADVRSVMKELGCGREEGESWHSLGRDK